MSNIIRSDIYRIKKGGALKVAIILAISIVLFIFFLTAATPAITAALPTDGMSASDIAEMEKDLAEVNETTLANSATFITEINGQNYLVFVFLTMILSIFVTDFDNGTYKNTLTYESSRKKVFFSKYILTLVACLGIKVLSLLTATIASVIFMGFSGLTGAFWLNFLLNFILQIPAYAAVIGVAFCITVFVKKASLFNLIYLFGIFAITLFTQIIPSIFPSTGFLLLFDPLQAVTLLATNTLTTMQTLISVGFFLVVTALSLVVGSIYFKKSDLK